ncbi:MAG: phosphatidate cytidylyltransferase [Burkholderiaceae bacterium]|nr:phosphatidate cytidylyltransferase [Burkholderiaceae bacterium]
MLRKRVITALALLAVLLPLLFHSRPEPFLLFSLLMVSAGAWEWGRMGGWSPRASVAAGLVFGGVMALWWWLMGLALPVYVWVLPAVLWVVGGGLLLRMGVPGWGKLASGLRISAGFVALAFAWVAMAQARTAGINFLLSVFFLVWAADVFAYFGGRAWGRRKLAPTISPGKSWAGAYTGAVGVVVVAAVWVWVDRTWVLDSPSVYSRLWQASPLGGTLALLGLAAMSVVGDLVESLVKRSAGVKDSSQLLPGHGGVLDRIDALLPVLPLVALLMSL